MDNFDPQTESRLFCLPLELRQLIYKNLIPHGAHLSMRDGRLLLSESIQPCPNDSFEGHERRSLSYLPRSENVLRTQRPRPDDVLHAQRLRSSWGPHWACGEVAARVKYSFIEQRDIGLDLLHTCRLAYLELLEFATSTSVIHLTDLNTLDVLLRQLLTLPPQVSNLETYLASGLSHVQSLSLVLRLDLDIFDAIEQAHQRGVCDSSKATTWLTLCPRIVAFKQLRKFDLWIDHDDVDEWTRVNERAFLSPLETLNSNEDLKITINLPKLHPKHETHDRHFLHSSPPALYTISRRFRQRLHGSYRDDGNGGQRLVVWPTTQFPILYQHDSGGDLATVEAMERPLWERGEDVEYMHWRQQLNLLEQMNRERLRRQRLEEEQQSLLEQQH